MEKPPVSELRMLLEAILFVADEPIPTADLAVLLERPTAEVESELQEMLAEAAPRGIVLRKAGGGWRFATNPGAAAYLEKFVADQRQPHLSQAALETLAIIAYRQPISKAQVAQIRGVNSDRAVRTLTVRGMIEQTSRDEGPGRAILYGTTTAFLEKAGVNDISELPPLADFMPEAQAVEAMESGLGPGI